MGEGPSGGFHDLIIIPLGDRIDFRVVWDCGDLIYSFAD